MHLLVAGVSWPPETFIARRLTGLAARGCKVTVAAAAPRQKACCRIEGAHLLRLPHSDDPRVLTAGRILWDGAALAAVAPGSLPGVFAAVRMRPGRWRSYVPLARLRPDLIHFEWNSAAVDYLPLLDVWKRPVVISCRGSQIHVRPRIPGNEEFAQALKDTFQRASAVHCVSEAILREAMCFGLDPAIARVIRPAVDPDFFCPPAARSGASGGAFRIVSTSSLTWVKGLEYSLIAVRRLVDWGIPVHFEVIGDGSKAERQRLLFTAEDLGLRDSVSFRGKAEPEQVRDALQGADAFVLSSLSEGISNGTLEAMACALPVVVTDCGGMREAVTDGVEGFVTPVRAPEAMAEALRRLAADPGLRAEMGRAGRCRVLRLFALDRQLDEFVSLYESLLQ